MTASMTAPVSQTAQFSNASPGDGAKLDGNDISSASTAGRHPWQVLATLSALMAFGPIATDMYLPALPSMAQALGSDVGTVEWTVSGYLVGFSLGQLFWGPLGDRFGRRGPVAAGILLFLIGAIGCATASSAGALIAWRVVQAAGSCAGIVLARAMVRDLYEGKRAAQMLSTLITIMALAPLVAPLVGGQVLVLGGWRAIFWTLVGIGVVTLIAVSRLPETLPKERRNDEPLMRAFAGYARLLRDRNVMTYGVSGAFFYVGIFAYIAGTPSAYITYHHVPANLYGLLFGASIVGIIAANMANGRLLRRIGSDRLLVLGAFLALAAGIASAVAALTDWGGLPGLATPLVLYCAASGFIVANSVAGALAGSPGQAGAVSALVGAMHYGSGVLGSGLVGAFADGTPRALGLVIAFAGIGVAACAVGIARRPYKIVHKEESK